jgi:hypothetical protein
MTWHGLMRLNFSRSLAKCSATSAGAYSIPTVRVGLRLGLFKALHRTGPVDSVANSGQG